MINFSGALTKSQFPVFTIYAQKSCLKLRPCERAWCIDRVQGYTLKGHTKRSAPATSRQDCLEMCLGETDFLCRYFFCCKLIFLFNYLIYVFHFRLTFKEISKILYLFMRIKKFY